ncbi:hypothetical protein HY450_00860 [Candidatus Pacearchaeota archaeon]|nr:hypothetical protein [Candidatus Pacearchaeota archaeon]
MSKVVKLNKNILSREERDFVIELDRNVNSRSEKFDYEDKRISIEMLKKLNREILEKEFSNLKRKL